MIIADFLVEQWLNPMDSKAKYNLGTSVVKPFSVEELLEITGQDKEAFIKEFLETSLHYHQGDSTGGARIKKAITGLYKGSVRPEDVLIVHAATGANDMVLMGLLEEGDNIVVIKPTYQQHYDIPRSMGVETREVKLEAKDGYILNMEVLRKVVDENTKLIVFSNPNNPTGATIYEDGLKAIVEIARSVDAYILSDEINRGMDEEYMPSILDMDYDKGIVVSSVSKLFSIPGTRIGWIATRDEEAYKNFENRRSYNTICCGIIDELLAAVAIENYEVIFERARRILEGNKKVLKEWLKTEKHVTLSGDPKGPTCLLKYDFEMDTTAMAEDAMEKDKLLLCHGACFDEEKSFRIGFGGVDNPEDFKKCLDAVSRYFKTLE